MIDLDDYIRAADPVRHGRIPDPSDIDAQRIIVSDRHRRRAHAAPVRLRWIAATGLVAILLVVSVMVISPFGGRTASAAAQVLYRAAALVRSQPVPKLAPGQSLYMTIDSLYQVSIYPGDPSTGPRPVLASASYTEREKIWTDSNGVDTASITRGPLQFSSIAQEAAWNSSSLGTGFSQAFQRHYNSVDTSQLRLDVSRLPTDPKVLETVIADGKTGLWVDHLPSGPRVTFTRAAALLVGPSFGMTPALRSALYSVLAAQPGVSVRQQVHTHDGRIGTAVGYTTTSGAAIERLIIDSRTGMALEEVIAPQGRLLPRSDTGSAPTKVCASGSMSCTALKATGTTVVSPLRIDQGPVQVVSSGTAQ